MAIARVNNSKTTQKTTQITTQETIQERILSLVKFKPSISRRELAEHIGISADGVKYHLGKMTSAGIVRHVGSKRAGHWEVLK